MAKNEAKKILVGLGNPGKEYANTYHNVGLLALSTLEEEKSPQTYRKLFEYIELDDIVFIRPLTYMNESGKAVRAALKKWNVKPRSLTVLHDESDLAVGDYKISFARSSAGHKGVQSIIDALKTNEFARVRIGIRPRHETRRQKAGEFALKKISTKDMAALEKVFKELSGAVYERD